VCGFPVFDQDSNAGTGYRQVTVGHGSDRDDRLVLFGTAGGSNPKATRAGYANAIVVGDAAYLVDCGEGVHRQLWRAGLTANPNYDARRPVVGAIFLTHLHADHIMDLANIFLGSWPPRPIDVYGPASAHTRRDGTPADLVHPVVFPDEPAPGLAATMDHLLRAFAYNINVRIADEGRSNVTESIRVHELGDIGPEPVVVYPEDERGVRVTAALVEHTPVFPAFGFRFDTPSGSVAFSGDTGPCDAVVRLAQGADILVHEVIDVDRLTARLTRLPNYEAIRDHLSRSHSAPEDVGTIATRAGVGTLVLSHLVPGDDEISAADWEARVRPTFAGRIVCGTDLDVFPVASPFHASSTTSDVVKQA
jgi:ribonuclease BN (tRNA processing enzyme)